MPGRRTPGRRRSLAAALLAFGLGSGVARADSVLPLSGSVDGAPPDHVLVPFEVPAGTAELQVAHDDLSDATVLDWGLLDPDGFRGWGGGNAEDAIVGALAASRSYLAGPIQPGTWWLVIGKAALASDPAPWQATVTLRDAPTLAPQPERAPYEPSPPLASGRRWYAGDLHVHSLESGDAQPSIGEVAAFARSRGLDFVELSEHNTVSQDDFLEHFQALSPELLLLPGIEVTTYDGHANAIGATAWVEHKIGLDGATIEASAQAVREQGAVFSINHPVLDLGDLCIGCAWEHALAGDLVGAVEIQTGGWDQTGWLFSELALAFWESMLDQGLHVAAVGGSDDHSAGTGTGQFDSPIGSPTTMVLADELSAEAIVRGIREGRTVVKLGGPGDPMVELTAILADGTTAEIGDAVKTGAATLRATVTGGVGTQVRLVRNGSGAAIFDVDADPFVAELPIEVALEGEERVRAEVVVDLHPQVVTSHIWFTYQDIPGPPAATTCGCGVAGLDDARPLGLVALLVVGSSLRRRARRSSQEVRP